MASRHINYSHTAISKLVLDRFNRLIDNAIVVLGTKEIIPAMVFSKIGRMSAYVDVTGPPGALLFDRDQRSH